MLLRIALLSRRVVLDSYHAKLWSKRVMEPEPIPSSPSSSMTARMKARSFCWRQIAAVSEDCNTIKLLYSYLEQL